MSPSLKVPRDTGVCRPPICPIRQAGYLPPAGDFYQALLLMLCQVIEQSQRASASPCARAPGAPRGVAAAGLRALRPAKYRLHVARIERHPPPVDPARAQGRARPAAGPLIQSGPAKGSRRRGLPGTVVGSVLGTPARLMLPAGVHLVQLALHTFLGEGRDCWPAQHHSYKDTGIQLQGKGFAQWSHYQ